MKMENDNMIVSDLTKRYRKKIALNHISCEFESGIYGILGPNGAGKTTLIRCILGLEHYSGNISDVNRNEIGYLPQKFSLFKQLSVYEALEYMCILKNAEQSEIERILPEVNLLEERNTKVKNLSGGMLRRLGIAHALIGDPSFLIVDEPTVGLDPKERVHFRNLLARIAKNRTVLITSHIVEDIEAIADKILLLKEGKILLSGDIEEVVTGISGKVGECLVSDGDISGFSEYNITDIMRKGNATRLHMVGDELPECEPVEPSLQDIYFYYLGGSPMSEAHF